MPNRAFKPFLCLALTLGCAVAAQAADAPAKRAITLDDLVRIERVGSPVVSPEGDWVAYTVSSIDAKEDKSRTRLWMAKWDGSARLQLTFGK